MARKNHGKGIDAILEGLDEMPSKPMIKKSRKLPAGHISRKNTEKITVNVDYDELHAARAIAYNSPRDSIRSLINRGLKLAIKEFDQEILNKYISTYEELNPS